MVRHFQNKAYRFFAFIVALQILNMSIDCPSARMPSYVSNAASFNYIDTFVEFIVEDVLKYDNAIPESKDRQHKEWQMQKQLELVCQQIEPLNITPVYSGKNKKNYIAFNNKYSFRYINEINPPPPKRCTC